MGQTPRAYNIVLPRDLYTTQGHRADISGGIVPLRSINTTGKRVSFGKTYFSVSCYGYWNNLPVMVYFLDGSSATEGSWLDSPRK